MGKKPVVVVVGLIWAGMVLVGCENCKNCRKKYDPAPAFGAKADAPVAKHDATPTPSVVMPTTGAAAKADTTKAVDPVGTKGFETPTVGTPTSAGSTPSPTIQSSLSPTTEGRPVALPGQSTEYRSGESAVSKSVPSDGGFRMPPRPPLSQVGGGLPSGVAEALPPISDQSKLPPSPLGKGMLPQPPVSPPSLPQPPVSPLPPSGLPPLPVSSTPSSTSNTMPSLDSIQK